MPFADLVTFPQALAIRGRPEQERTVLQMSHSSQRINALAQRLNLRTYLEVGVCDGETFRLIEIPDRTGVDPDFRFDPAMMGSAGIRLISETSDAYFAKLPISVKFDLIFIDGLHTFEQVVRDFSNAVLHTHDRSIILLDDTLPSDVYSSLRDKQDTFFFRSQFGGPANAAWHGDVYKTVLYLNDFWPSMNYRTLITGGNPQTLVWRSITESHPPVFNSLETISRLTFFEFCKHTAVLRGVAQEEGLDLCVREVLS